MAKRPYSVRLLVSDLAAAAADYADHALSTGEVFTAESATREVFGAALTGITEPNRVVPMITCNLKDNSSGRGIFSDEIPLSCITGDAKNPYFFPYPLVFKSKPYLEVTNISTDTAYKRVYVVLHGFLEDGQGA